MKLDLGSGKKPMEGFLGVDNVPWLTDFTVELASGEPWPFEDDSDWNVADESMMQLVAEKP